MKRIFGTLLICVFLFGSVAQAAAAKGKPAGPKAAQKRIKKAQKKNAKAHKAARKASPRREQAPKAGN